MPTILKTGKRPLIIICSMENNLQVIDQQFMKRRSATFTISSLTGLLLLIPAMFVVQHDTYAQALSASEQALAKEKVLSLYIRINAPLDSVWERVSTEKGFH